MSQDLVYKPRVTIDGVEVVYLQSVSLNTKNNSSLNNLTVSCSSSGIKESSLFGKRISFFLNCGSEDGSPIFVGYIKEANTTEDKISITAVDVRGFLQDSSKIINLTDDNNYDGYTLGSFLKKYIINNINTDGVTYINTDVMNDTSPKVSLTGVRGTFTPYDLIQKQLEKIVDNNDIQQPLDYIIDVFEDGIIFKKKKSLDSVPSMVLSENNGIKSYTYKERIPKFLAGYDDKVLKYGSNPSGPFSTEKSKTDKEYPAEQRMESYIELVKELKNTQEITVNATLGHYIDLESIIQLEVNDSNISGTHRITSKSIICNRTNISLKLGLNKKQPLLKDFLS